MSAVAENTRVRSVLEDPSSQAIAQTYASSFLNAAGATASDALVELTSFVDDILSTNPEFDRLLTSGVLNGDQRLRLIERTIAPVASVFFTNFLRVVSKHDRTSLLTQIAAAATQEAERREGKQRVQVISATQLEQVTLEAVRNRLRDVFGFEPVLEARVDAKLIGGLVIRVGNSVYDGSLRSRLGQLAKRMQQRSLHEIQSGRDRFSHPEGD